MDRRVTRLPVSIEHLHHALKRWFDVICRRFLLSLDAHRLNFIGVEPNNLRDSFTRDLYLFKLNLDIDGLIVDAEQSAPQKNHRYWSKSDESAAMISAVLESSRADCVLLHADRVVARW